MTLAVSGRGPVSDGLRRQTPAPETFWDLGLGMLLETVAFEGFPSRVSDQIGDALTSHYQFSDDAGPASFV